VSTREDHPEYWATIATDEAVAAMRARSLDTFATVARGSLGNRLVDGKSVEVNAVVLRVAQYWNDNADDEVHLRVIACADEPLGLHACRWGSTDEDGPGDGSYCDMCWRTSMSAEALNQPYTALIPAFEAFCREHAHQDAEHDDSYRPYAIARASGVDVVGQLVRPWLDMPQTQRDLLRHDDRMLALAGESSEVLADYLEDRGDPRRAIFDGAGDPRLWLGELDRVVPRSALALANGVPDEIGLYIADDIELGPRDGTLALAFRPRVRFLPSSKRTIWPALATARALGPLGAVELEAIVDSPVPFLASEIEIDETAYDLEALAAAMPNLPRVRTLRLTGAFPRSTLGALRVWDGLAALARLELATYLAEFVDEVVAWRSAKLPVPVAVSMFDHETERAAGWSVEPDGSIRYLGYHRHADRARLEALRGARR
jgi:hypothetical protein